MITLKDLTEEQLLALEELKSFLRGSIRQFLLAGYAGTGKTTLINILLEHIDKFYGKGEYEVTCTAPTNEAVRIISKKSNKDYQRTIYSLMGLVLQEVDDTKSILVQKGRAHINDYDLVIIDEASMINDDLYDKIQSALLMYSHVKILYVGDDAQLPPVDNKEDENGNKLPSKVFDGDIKGVKLQEVKRVTDNNPILRVVTNIRHNIKSKEDRFIRHTEYDSELCQGIIFSNNKDAYVRDMLAHFTTEEYVEDNDFVRAIAYTNEEVNYLNTEIRKAIFGDGLVEYEIGENLIVDAPIMDKKRGKIVLFDTGTRLKVTKAAEVKASNCDFKCWDLSVRSYGNFDGASVKGKIRVVSKDTMPLFLKLMRALANKSKLAQKQGVRHAWFSYFEFKNQFDRVKYSYAATVHKCQGQTFKNVFVNEDDINILKWDDSERNKLKYVAFTRPSHKLVVFKT